MLKQNQNSNQSPRSQTTQPEPKFPEKKVSTPPNEGPSVGWQNNSSRTSSPNSESESGYEPLHKTLPKDRIGYLDLQGKVHEIDGTAISLNVTMSQVQGHPMLQAITIPSLHLVCFPQEFLYNISEYLRNKEAKENTSKGDKEENKEGEKGV
jgi:hypothetical protein